jgi:hypothetical protein
MRSTTRRPGLAAATAVLVGLSMTGCSTSPGVSNGSVSVCFRAIPVGRGALNDPSAKLIGVHRVPVDKVRSHLPPSAESELAAEDDTAVCAMAFRGSFAAGQVESAPAGQAGDYALVLVSSKELHLVAALVLEHLPKAFGGRTI